MKKKKENYFKKKEPLGSKTFWFVLLILWMIEIFALSQIPGTEYRYSDIIYLFERKAAHAIEFFILAFLLYRVFRFYDFSLKKKFGVILFVSIWYALSDEFHQLFIFGREGKLLDVGIDFIGVIIFLSVALVWQRYLKGNHQ